MTTEFTAKQNPECPSPITYGIGDWFLNDQDNLCVLTQTDSSYVQMITMRKGISNRYAEGVFVKNIYDITWEEFSKIIGYKGTFTLLKKVSLQYEM